MKLLICWIICFMLLPVTLPTAAKTFHVINLEESYTSKVMALMASQQRTGSNESIQLFFLNQSRSIGVKAPTSLHSIFPMREFYDPPTPRYYRGKACFMIRNPLGLSPAAFLQLGSKSETDM